ncbi:bacteriorhodopsin [uncultured Croceicoccus sp.]|uniref:bacteriorhodopsin n=1 Tax=uncultured Croceicoccus sp. TaxID=1295329 RepID=UPI002606C682|nr:bacteriorhodopsin [uncultured Croceicoccus sp.]
MSTDNLPLLIGFIVMSVSSLALYVSGDKGKTFRHHTHFHSVVPFIAATAYLAMLLGVGVIEIGGETIYLARYADWTVTTPILLTGLVLTALHEHHRFSGFVVSVVILDVLMVLTGLLSALAPDAGARWIWFWWSSAAFAGVLYLLWKPVRERSEHYGQPLDSIYKKNLAFVTVVWLAYPIVFAIGPQGLRITDTVTNVWIILALDIIAKVVYGFVSVRRFGKVDETAVDLA